MNKPSTNLSQAFQSVRADYDMSRESRFVRRRTGLAPTGGSADYHYRNESAYYRDIEKARDMDRNDAIVGQTVDRAVSNIVQEGFSLDPNTGDKAVSQELKARWIDWSESADDCDIAGESTFRDMERQVMRSSLVDGDIAALGTVDGALQLLEGHTIKTKSTKQNVVLGVELDRLRKRKRFWLTHDSITPNGVSVSVEESKDVRDSDGNRILFHVYNPKRSASQTRGVTAFAPIFSTAGMFEDINFAKLVQQQIVSCFTIFREQAMSGGDGSPPAISGDEYGDVHSEQTDSGVRTIKGISPGMEFIGNPGEKLQGFSPNVPNAEFFNHVKLMLQLIGVNLGLPLCLVLMDGSETNFSGWRGAVDEARKGFKANQTNLKQKFHRPVYAWKVRQFIAEDPALMRAAARLGKSMFCHNWNAPAWQYIEPLKDAQGDAFQLQNALTSPRRLHGRRGQDWDDITDEVVEDYSMAIIKAKRAAIDINTSIDDDQPVHWRELMPVSMPSGLKMDIKDPNAIAQENPDE